MEARRVLAAAIWNNVVSPLNVSGDSEGYVTPLDVLLVVNELNGPKWSEPSSSLLPKQIEEGLTPPFLDVSCDGHVSPIDALIIVNDLNSDSPTQPGGGFHSQGGTYANAACSPQLIEGTAFSSELTRVLTTPDDPSAIQIAFRAPVFDLTSKHNIRDAFEIEVTDSQGNLIASPYLSSRDAAYNWSEDLSPVFGGGTQTTTAAGSDEDSTATIDLSGIPSGTQVHVTARLVNNDSDDGTSVIVRGYEFVDALLDPSTAVPQSDSPNRQLAPMDTSELQDLSGSFSATYGRTSLAGENSELYTDLMVTNKGSQAVTGRIVVAIDNFSELDANAMHPDGILQDGRPFFDLTDEMNGQPLEPGQSLSSREIAFLNNSGNRFDYKLSTLGVVNSPPGEFVTTPVLSIEAGKTYGYRAQALDPDNQPLSYSKVSGPESMQVEAQTGEVVWATETPDVGSHNIVLRATDPHGLFVEQAYTLNVLASLQNRPPNFVSDPVTEAIASSGFEISTVGVGDAPAGVAVVSGFRGPGLVTLNAGDQTLSQIDSLGNDQFDLPMRVSVGEPAPSGQVLRSGYSIDVGLPAFESTNDRNQIRGMDQADLNGDGTLDLVVSGFIVESRLPRTYQQVITVTLGNPDGTFGEATTVAVLSTHNSANFRTLRVADFDNDGQFDILTTDQRTAELHFLKGDGRGGFGGVVTSTLNASIAHFKTADLDQDGVLDLVAGLSSQKEFGYMLGNGDGTFTDFVNVYGDPSSPNINSGPDRNYAVADMDGDGDLDIVLGDHLGRTVNVLSNDGALGFEVVATLDALIPFYPFRPVTPDRVYTVFAADFNGDGNQDIAFTTYRASSGRQGGLGVYLGDGSGKNFIYQDGADAIVTFPNNAAGNGDPVDLDGDGDLDIVLASSAGGIGSAGQMPSVLINRGDGTFTTTNLTVPVFSNAPYESATNEANAKGVLVGDYNQDGLLDLSTYRSISPSVRGVTFASVSVVLADQPGVFASSSSLLYENVTNAPKVFFETGDFDNDGIVDLWSPSYQGISRTWLGLGDGSFEDPFPATPAIGNEGLTSGTVEDFNQDGILDVFWNGVGGVQNGPLPRYLAALGNGDGTFEITFQEPTASGARRPDWGDFNGDGFLDFASSNNDGVQVFLYDVDNPGTWVFDNEILFSDLGAGAVGYSFAMSINDFDQDGNSDVAVVARLTDEPFRLVVYPGLGDGTFTAPVSTHFGEAATDYTNPTWMATGDFDEDGNPDVAVYEHLSISVHLGIGDGTFGRTDIYPALGVLDRSDPQLFVRDIDHDGHDDVLFTDSIGSQSIGVLPGNGDGSFRDRTAYDVPNREGSVAFGDFDNDGREDVVFNSQSDGNFATILNGVRRRLTDIISVDVNGDGNDDVFATYTDSSRVKWFLGDNLGNLNRQPDLFTDFGPVALTVSDLDDNGSTEIITANRSARSVSIFSGGVDNWTRNDIDVGQAPIDVLSGLVDSDELLDLLVIDEANEALWVLTGNGDTSFAQPVAVPLGDRPNALLLADVDADGTNDVIISLPDSNRVMILPGDGQGGFAAPHYVALSGTPTAIAAVDFNQDGNLDLSVTLGELDQVAIIYGRGQNQFAQPQLIRVGDNPVAMSAEDADDDGRIDLVVSNQGDDTVSVIYNRFDPNEVYRYDADAIDPDGDTLTYAIDDGPGGLIINSETGALLWAASPDQVGEHSVTISADDGRGGVATQSFRIDVQPARDNATPLLATEPETTIGANEIFTYQATALDDDNDAVRYRLLESPAEATIDATTGLLTWDGRGEGRKFNEFGQPGSFQIAKDASFQTPSVTVEGWFNIHTLTASNGKADLFKQRNSADNTFYLGLLFNNTLRLTTRNGSQSLDYRVPFVQKADRWYHLALTIDDATRTATLYVDGQIVGETLIPAELDYNSDFPFSINGGQASVDNFRVWSVARSQHEIQQGMAEQYNNNPLLTIDLRFDKTTSYTAHDSSLYQNDGYLVPGPGVPQRTSGLANVGQHSFRVGVEDGRGGYDEQSFNVEVLPELRGSIVGHLFDDLNGDGDQDDGSEDGVPAEQSLENWHLYIDANGNAYPDPSEPYATTDVDGNYRIDGLLPGDYSMRISPVAGYDVPTDASSIIVAFNEEAQFDLAAERLALSHIRGQLQTEAGDPIAYWKAYADLDDNGTRDETEPMAMSDREGNYALTGLDAGDYTIRPDLPAGWADTAGSDGLAITLATDEILSDNDFVLEPMNTSVTGGAHFVTMPSTTIEARQTFRYASIAMGVSSDVITYDLSLAPDGMTIDPGTGLVAWRPAINQVGEHLVISRATSASGSIALHDFYLTVTAPNTPPVILTELLPSKVYVGQQSAYDVVAQDAESTTISYALAPNILTAAIDTDTGRIQWVPAASDLGSQSLDLEVTDDAGEISRATWSFEVVDSAPDVLPLEVTLPRQTAGVTTNYFSRISAIDAIGRPVSWSLSSGPSGLVIDTDGTIQWTPSSDQLGPQSIELLGMTADGSTETVGFDIEVTGRNLNAKPSIDSMPHTSVSLGENFEYDLSVSDADHDAVAFTLLAAPIGMSVHPSLGHVRWNPASDQLGEHDVVLQVSDPSGDTDEQEFKLKVSRFGGPPRIASVPPTEASVGNAFLHSVIAVDREGDPLTYGLLTAPRGMSIVETTGEISWTPAADQVGQQDVVIQVSDGIGGAATQAFVINVGTGVPNLPPEITSSSPRFGAVGSTYSYTLMANDPENTTITYSLREGPAGMAVDSGSGQVSWTPTSGQEGKHVVTLVATDSGGASAIESFEFDVLAQNTSPSINSMAPGEVAAGAEFMYDVLASDTDLDQLGFVLEQAPAGANIDSFGRIRWQTEVALIGSHDFAVKVIDPRGGEAMQSFTLDVIEDVVAPKLSAILSPGDSPVGNTPWGNQFRIFVRAIDNVAIASLTLKANGQDIPLDAAGTAEFTFEQWGFSSITATATAIDTNGNITTKTNTFAYDFPEGWNGAGGEEVPTAVITSPTDAADVTGMVSIVGTASHDDFAAYKLSYRRVDDTAFTEFFESSTPVTNGELGVWDTSLLLNDEYVIRLQVATNDSVVNVVDVNVGLAGALKLGNFQLSFTDMVIPVAGIPIEITRIYDTLQADRQGDFGYGWRLEYRNTDLRVGLPKSGLEDIGIYSALRPGVRVYLNIPGEGRQGFTFDPIIRVLPGFGDDNLVLARPRFTPDPGVTSTLSTGVSQYLQVNPQGELYAPGGIPYNPASPDFGGAYVLTTREGITYRINGASGELSSADDRNGNRVTFTDTSIRSSGGKEVAFTLDAKGRIIEISDPEGNSTRYDYSSAGDLEATTDREGNVTQYVYSDVQEHFLEDVIDPLGRVGRRAEYNAEGRLVRMLDANGVAVESSYDPANFLVEVSDQLGNTTFYEYDQFGNIVSEVDPLGGIQQTTYNALGLPTVETDALGRTTKRSYDALGNEVTKTDASGFTTRTSYGAFSIPTSRTDAVGHTVRAVVDSQGVTSKLIGSTGTEVSFPNGSTQESVSITFDETGTETNIVLSDDQPTTVTDANGQVVQIEYDLNNQLIAIMTEVATENGVQFIEQRQEYDGNGRTIAEVDANGNTTRFEYDAAGNLTSATTPAGRRFSYEYDDRNLLIETTFPDGTQSQRRYDAAGNLVATVDQAGHETTYEYDPLNRLIVTVFPDDTPEDASDNPRIRFTYDLAGQLVAEIDELGNQTSYGYDAVGNRILVVDALGGETHFEYDANRKLTLQRDALGFVTKFEYDASGRHTAVVYPDRTHQRAVVGARGQNTSITNQAGETTLYEYDSLQRLTAVVDPLGNRTRYEYDGLGRVVNLTDALGNSTRHEYDTLGRLVATELVTGESETFTYDEDGHLTSKTDFNGDTTTFDHDELGRVVRQESPDVTIVRTYSPTGMQLSESDGRGTTRFEYDERNRLTLKAEPDGQTLAYSYDAVGNTTEMASLSGSLRYSYDALNRVTSVFDFAGSETTLRYDAVGNLVQIGHPNSILETRAYDYARRVTSIQLADDSDVLESFVYTLDAAGRRASLVELSGRTVVYSYDAAGRLQRETVEDPTSEIVETTYTYDAVGNRLSMQTNQDEPVTYAYDSRSRLLREVVGSQEVVYSYDANGNLLSNEAGADDHTVYRWDSQGRLISATQTSGGETTTVEFEYDSDGNRVSRTKDGTGVKYLVDSNREYSQVIEEYDGQGNVQVAYVYGPNETGRLSQIIGSEQTYLHPDHLGSIRTTTDASGVIVDQVQYAAYGEVTKRTGTTRLDYLYAGEFRDDVTGLDYLRARHLDVSLGQFVSTDPFDGFLNSPDSLQPYLYAGLDPINNRDPSGETTLVEGLVTSLIIGTLNGLFVGSVNAIFGGRFSTGFYTGFTIGFTLTAGALTGAGLLASSRAAGIAFRAGTFSTQRFAALASLNEAGKATVGAAIATLITDFGIGAFQLVDYLVTSEAGSDQNPNQTLVSGDSAQDVFNLGRTLRPSGQ